MIVLEILLALIDSLYIVCFTDIEKRTIAENWTIVALISVILFVIFSWSPLLAGAAAIVTMLMTAIFITV